MKLLIITQKVDKDDDTLGFFHNWIIEFAKQYEKVSVICLYKGKYDLPNNVAVYSLGKELGFSKFTYIQNFYSYIFSLRHEYDSVFVHMNQIYVILGGIFWKLWNKKIGLWYVHRQKSFSLRIAEKLVDFIFTAAKESFTVATKKLHIVGHGIETSSYVAPSYVMHGGVKRLLQVGRITSIKRCDLAIDALSILNSQNSNKYTLRFVGKPITDQDNHYFESLKQKVSELDLEKTVTFVGALPPSLTIEEFSKADATINLAPTGGIDKVVLESMASGRVVFSTNQAFAEYFRPYEEVLLLSDDSESIAKSVLSLFARSDIHEISVHLQNTVQNMSSLPKLISRISTILQ